MKTESSKKEPKFSEIWDEVVDNHGYQLVEVLGEGSFGTVAKAKNTRNGNDVAIKLILEPFTN